MAQPLQAQQLLLYTPGLVGHVQDKRAVPVAYKHACYLPLQASKHLSSKQRVPRGCRGAKQLQVSL
jgi:hypothetical protein